jgi:PTS system nitrogen regulatory IIA component
LNVNKAVALFGRSCRFQGNTSLNGWAIFIREFNFAMHVNFSILPEAVALVRLETVQQILEELSKMFADVYGVDAGLVLDGLEQREALGSTGFGRGVAIPHCRSSDVSRPTVILLKLENAVDFKAADSVPVSLVFGLISPENAGATHLHALAAISRIARDDAILAALVDAPDAEALFAVLTNQFLRNAA